MSSQRSGIQLTPDLVRRVVPRRPQIQCQLRQGIEAFDFGRQQVIDRMGGSLSLAHALSLMKIVKSFNDIPFPFGKTGQVER